MAPKSSISCHVVLNARERRWGWKSYMSNGHSFRGRKPSAFAGDIESNNWRYL